MRRLLAGLAATAAVATSLLISSAGPATAAAPESSTSNVSGGGVTPNSRLPLAIRVDESKNKVVATLRGVGKQIYDCTSGTATFREPAAGLFTSRGIPAGIHGKGPGPGPFWTNFDGSRVDGSGAVSAPSPDSTRNVPWLRLNATSVGTGAFGGLTFIQRIDTRGGVAPSPCNAPTVAVDYTANYVFWGPK
jgi:Protein of unknown function (DUF3455)